MTQDNDPTSRPSSLTKKLAEEQKDKTSHRSSWDENSWPFELPARLARKTHTQAVSMEPSSSQGAAIIAGIILGDTEAKLSADTAARLLTDLARGAREALDKAGVPQASAESFDLAGRICWLSQARQEARRILSELAELLGHNGDAGTPLIQRVIDNQKVEDDTRRRLEDERTSWMILERRLDTALSQVKILEQQRKEDPDKTHL